jgi:hypothetical protein
LDYASAGHSGFEPADATIVKTGQTNWIDLTDGGATTLHTHAAYVLKSGDIMSGDLRGMDLIGTRSGTITRTGDYISSVAKIGGRTITISRDVNNYITSATDATNTWTFTRDANNRITSWAVT